MHIDEILSGPWAIERSRFPFVGAILAGVAAGRRAPQDPTYQARLHPAANAARRRQVSHGAIAVLPFYGVAVQRTDALGEALGLLSLWHFTQAFRIALADDSVRGIVIDVDSPGGSIYGVMELAEEIYRSRVRKPVFAVANSLAASGAYWIASAASELYVTPGGEVGGIGVHDMHVDISKGLEKAGIEMTLIAAGKYKTEGNQFQPLGAGARAAMQKRIDAYYRAFVASVAKHRNVPESAVRSGMGQGRLLDAERAKRENMVDGVATFDEVLRRLVQRISHIKQTGPFSRATAWPPRQLVIDASNRRPSKEASPLVERIAIRMREIELLTLLH